MAVIIQYRKEWKHFLKRCIKKSFTFLVDVLKTTHWNTAVQIFLALLLQWVRKVLQTMMWLVYSIRKLQTISFTNNVICVYVKNVKVELLLKTVNRIFSDCCGFHVQWTNINSEPIMNEKQNVHLDCVLFLYSRIVFTRGKKTT